ncbi:MAG: hypothetical protein WAN11_11430 [Syntrophobacteraceae bacterium]
MTELIYDLYVVMTVFHVVLWEIPYNQYTTTVLLPGARHAGLCLCDLDVAGPQFDFKHSKE